MAKSISSETSSGATRQAKHADNSKWTIEEIDRYLFLLAQEAAPLLSSTWSDFAAAAKRQGDAAAGRAKNWEEMLAVGPKRFSQGLLSQIEGIHTLRRIAPLFAVVPRERREELLREAALSGSCATTYRERWEGSLEPGNFIDSIVEALLANMAGDLREAFTEFVVASGQTKWLIAGDFCLKDESRPNAVFAFTVFPYYADFIAILDEIRTVFPKDLKRTKSITPEMIGFLRSMHRFHFAFVVDKNRSLFKTVKEARDGIDQTLLMMLKYRDAECNSASIATLRALRQTANANGFKRKLLADIIIMATFGAFIATLLQVEGRAEQIHIFPDRDDMTTTYGTLAYELFDYDASAFAVRRRVPESQIGLALPGPRTDGKRGMYFDELIRLPDYIAGGVAGTALTGPRTTAVTQKCADIVNKGLVDSNNVAILRVDLPPKTLQASRIVVRSTPPDGPATGTQKPQ